MIRSIHTIAKFALLLTSAAAGLGSAHAQSYSITDLGSFGGNDTVAQGINDSGQVVGMSRLANSTADAFVWTQGQLSAPMQFISSSASAINDSGQIVGVANTASGRSAPIVAGYEIGYTGAATAISNNGVAVGVYNPGYGENHAALWNTKTWNPNNTLPQDLGTLPGSPYFQSQANGVNDQGLVVGWSDTLPNPYQYREHAVSWQNGTIKDLGVLGDSSGSAGSSQALGVNNQGQIVGKSTNVNGSWSAVIWQDGQIQDLGGLDGATFSQANKINSLGQIVGNSGDHAILWSDGKVLDLNNLVPGLSGWTLEDAVDINDQGQIAVNAINVGGSIREAFLLTPTSVPEPTTLVLFALGLPALLCAKKLRRISGPA